MSEEKTDWLDEFIDAGISLPWESGDWEMFDRHAGGWFDVDLSKVDPGEKALALAERLAESCSKEQLNTVAELLYLAIKATRQTCEG